MALEEASMVRALQRFLGAERPGSQEATVPEAEREGAGELVWDLTVDAEAARVLLAARAEDVCSHVLRTGSSRLRELAAGILANLEKSGSAALDEFVDSEDPYVLAELLRLFAATRQSPNLGKLSFILRNALDPHVLTRALDLALTINYLDGQAALAAIEFPPPELAGATSICFGSGLDAALRYLELCALRKKSLPKEPIERLVLKLDGPDELASAVCALAAVTREPSPEIRDRLLRVLDRALPDDPTAAGAAAIHLLSLAPDDPPLASIPSALDTTREGWMMKISWRRFAFFRKESAGENPEAVSVAYCEGRFVLGFADGRVVVGEDEVLCTFDKGPALVSAFKQTVFAVGDGVGKWFFDFVEQQESIIQIPGGVVSAIATSEKRRAVGYADGTIWCEKQRFSMRSEITNLKFNGDGVLFGTTRDEVCCLEPFRKVLASAGCEPGCADARDDDLIVGRDDGIYYYSTEERGSTFGIDGLKQHVACLGSSYVLVASRHEKSRRSEVHAYDFKKKRVVHFHRLPAGQSVYAAVGAGTSALVYSKPDGALVTLTEISTRDKLDVLYRMNLYPMAVEIATGAGLPPGDVMDIYKMYGDHLYKKCDWEGSVQQYARTIGRLEPSYVIQRFLEAQRLENLATYLELWHRDSSSDDEMKRPELTTLLINCYAKLKDVSKLDEFCSADEIRYDAKVAVAALKDAGYSDHALRVAAKHREHLAYAQLSVEAETLDERIFEHLAQVVSEEEVETFVLRYGKKLATKFPERATELLMRMAPKEPQNFIHLFVDQPKYLRVFLEYMKQHHQKNEKISNTLLELALDEWVDATRQYKDPLANAHELSYEQRVKVKADDVMHILEQGGYDPFVALVLVETRKFQRGRLYLFAESDLRDKLPSALVDYVLLETYAEQNQIDEMLRIVRHSTNTRLWHKLLSHAVSAVPRPGEDGFFDRCDDLQNVLSVVDQDQILKPQRCLQACAKNPHVPLFAVRPFLSRLLEASRDTTSKARAAVADLRAQVAIMRSDRDELRATLPFEEEDEDDRDRDPQDRDPASSSSNNNNNNNNKWEEIKKSQRATAHDHEQFFKELEEARDDPFSVIINYFGKGVMR
ncbi:hypothetical protein CTAYLR_009188 [Chrysophaeum taylorii]|uniref:Uncharacterized protein n=1 Tax=Chrysophaeum taylorii TaxID=2483200 RepID=A0AAD7XTC0_9STRA|nr:hypothetical protein CTAYLR_009188 [Chrysophaeum taylorii]